MISAKEKTLESKDGLTMEAYTTREFLKFLIPSILGVFLFLFPVFDDGAVNIPLGYLINFFKGIFKPFGLQVILGVIVLSAVVTLAHLIFKFEFIEKSKYWKGIFGVTWVGILIRTLALVFVAILVLKPEGAAFEIVLNPNTGELAASMLFTIFVTFLITLYTIPLISDYGIMDFTGTVFRSLTYPLFKLPGRSTVDLITSWVGGNSSGILITIRQYVTGYYSAREAVIISTMFSVVSLPFCLVIANTLGVGDQFLLFYGILVLVGIISTVIMVRIPPLSTFSNGTFEDQPYKTQEVAPSGVNKYSWALNQSVHKAKAGGNISDILRNGTKSYVELFLTLAPTVLTIAVVSLVILEYTPIFDWISKPMGYYLQLLGVEEAFEAAPATLIGFADMFLPAIVGSTIVSMKTRFIIGVLSLVQIIYLSEMGAVLIGSQIPINIKHMALIFLEKTMISLPLIVFFANVFGV